MTEIDEEFILKYYENLCRFCLRTENLIPIVNKKGKLNKDIKTYIDSDYIEVFSCLI